MSEVILEAVNPILITAVVTSDLSGYTVTFEYDVPPPTTFDDIVDRFHSVPETISVQVSSTTLPTGHYLAASGAGTWTASSASSLSGVFVTHDVNVFCFTINVMNGSERVAHRDPRLIIRKLGSV